LCSPRSTSRRQARKGQMPDLRSRWRCRDERRIAARRSSAHHFGATRRATGRRAPSPGRTGQNGSRRSSLDRKACGFKTIQDVSKALRRNRLSVQHVEQARYPDVSEVRRVTKVLLQKRGPNREPGAEHADAIVASY
jgi:hypothetical protein